MRRAVLVSLFLTFAIVAAGQSATTPRVWEVRNNEEFRNLFPRLNPGDELVLHEGVYEGTVVLNRSGEPGRNIVIRGYGKGEARPILLLENRGNLMQLNASNVVIDYLEFRSKYGYSMRIGTSKEQPEYRNITISNCIFRECGGGDISANSSLVYDNIQITGNYFIGSKKTPVYIGIHDGKAQVTNFVFKENVIDGTRIFGENITGYGIQLKLNVTGGLIENNYITGTKGPGIMVYGSEDANPDNANIVRNNIVAGSRHSAGIVVGGGPSIVEGNVSIQCNGGISVQNYDGRNLLHQITLQDNTVCCSRSYGISFGNMADINASGNRVIASEDARTFTNNPTEGRNNEALVLTQSHSDTACEALRETIPAKHNLSQLWQLVASGPLTQAEVEHIAGVVVKK